MENKINNAVNNTMKKLITQCLMVTGIAAPVVQAADDLPPAQDVYLAQLNMAAGQNALSRVTNITNRRGYDNQPFFSLDGSGLLYTAQFQGEDGELQTDIMSFSFATCQHTNLTNSAVSEYSPTEINGGAAFSSVVVEPDGKQYLWSYIKPRQAQQGSAITTTDGSIKAIAQGRMTEAEPVGYHAWGPQEQAMMFILGEPHTAQFFSDLLKDGKVIADNPGRSFRYVPSRNRYTFMMQEKSSWWLVEYSPEKDELIKLVLMPYEAEYFTWVDDKTAITARGSQLLKWNYQGKEQQSVAQWKPWVDVSAQCSTKISRLAVNSDATMLAFVCDEKVEESREP